MVSYDGIFFHVEEASQEEASQEMFPLQSEYSSLNCRWHPPPFPTGTALCGWQGVKSQEPFFSAVRVRDFLPSLQKHKMEMLYPHVTLIAVVDNECDV